MATTNHQRRILAAMVAVQCLSVPAGRKEIARILSQGRSGIQVRTMLAMRDSGLVIPESELVVRLVTERVCICGCDRWMLTPQGDSEGRKLKVQWSPQAMYYAKRLVVTNLTQGNNRLDYDWLK
jgi:hypothetical protein